jgi:osmoprotectant transport system permease protein
VAAKGIIEWSRTYRDDIAQASVEHLRLVGISMAIATTVALPIAMVVRRRRVPTAIASGTGTFFYNIPSFALFALLVPVVGIGDPPAIIALAIFAFGLIVRNAVVGLDSVPGAHLEAAKGMGMTRLQTLRRVELPHALPAIVTGLRLATVSTVAIATIGAFIGSGGLGTLILQRGIQRDLYIPPIVAGFVCAMLMAIVIDLTLIGLLRVATPWLRVGR